MPPVEAEGRILQTRHTPGNVAGRPAPGTDTDADRARRAARREPERKRRAAVRALRPWIGPACFLAAALPFAVAPVGWGWSAGRTAGFFLLRPAGTLGVALAILGATVAAVLTHRRNTLGGLLACVSGALIAGVAGLAVARGLVGF